jgi:branched-chain amino acid transport system permease protein
VTTFVQLVVSGLAVGSIYGLVALGFVVIFKSTGIFNFAQGDLVMVGAYACYWCMATAGVSLIPAVVCTLVASLAFGWLLHKALFKPMLGSSFLAIVFVTVALSMILQAGVFIAFGPTDRGLPDRLPANSVKILGITTSSLDLTVMAVAATTILVFGVFFRFTRWGLRLRAIGENPEASAVIGLNADRLFATAMMIGAFTAAIGGILLANLQTVSLSLSEIGILAFPAAVLGGMRSVPGAVVGGLVIGVIGTLTTGYIGGDEANPAIYVVLLLVLLVRPQGILGTKEVIRV